MREKKNGSGGIYPPTKTVIFEIDNLYAGINRN